ncbi:hypothetical protein FA95DRAFT_420699 [Auriscalpium vulgare]|uniref:Uncharacterized protein n=1 Tax=Auriscalpium vulgare TaxID=40419 RepID=A0ACB8S540_9AGAM|nr:hypothetical protein FA95DRAFT_420699 [Auriscalpium vulgare]
MSCLPMAALVLASWHWSMRRVITVYGKRLSYSGDGRSSPLGAAAGRDTLPGHYRDAWRPSRPQLNASSYQPTFCTNLPSRNAPAVYMATCAPPEPSRLQAFPPLNACSMQNPIGADLSTAVPRCPQTCISQCSCSASLISYEP